MSDYVSLSLHHAEETVSCDFAAAFVPCPSSPANNPITDYFDTSRGLVAKIVGTIYHNDSEVLGLLVLGVLSAAEFYFRTVLSEASRMCPVCVGHTEAVNVPAGSFSFYSKSGFPSAMSAFEHESLADSKKIISEIKRFAGVSCPDNSSVRKALDDFELLCEMRHCFVHARGFVGLKAARALSAPRSLQRIVIDQNQALDFIKLSHNAVRAVNNHLSKEILNRWIDRDVLVGVWGSDKRLFKQYIGLFAKTGEDSYGGDANKAYKLVRPAILKRQQAIAAKS